MKNLIVAREEARQAKDDSVYRRVAKGRFFFHPPSCLKPSEKYRFIFAGTLSGLKYKKNQVIARKFAFFGLVFRKTRIFALKMSLLWSKIQIIWWVVTRK